MILNPALYALYSMYKGKVEGPCSANDYPVNRKQTGVYIATFSRHSTAAAVACHVTMYLHMSVTDYGSEMGVDSIRAHLEGMPYLEIHIVGDGRPAREGLHRAHITRSLHVSSH